MATGTTFRDDRRKLDAILREVRKLRGSTVTVGVHDDAGQHTDSEESVAEIAAKHEFGSGRIPERSFLRSTVDGSPSIANNAKAAAGQVCDGTMRARVAVERIGVQAVGAVKATIHAGIAPPLSPQRIEQRREKGSHGGGLASAADDLTPLIDTGQLIQSIQFRIEGGGPGWGKARKDTSAAADAPAQTEATP